ncbi:MAG: taurine dioxygenase [Deltaproteobacteria bacterium]|nr:taurine dioxygenase [Deltaproteobacteria bacterium]
MLKNAQVKRLAHSLGAEIRGVQLTDIKSSQAREIEDLLWEHQVLFFPDQSLTATEHVRFGELFGELEAHPHLMHSDVESETDAAKILELKASRGGVADEWHSDLSFMPEPARVSILRMVKCPEIGGDTLWANLYMAFEELSEPLRDLCEGLSALHNAEPHGRPEIMMIHPMVRVHPETGRKVLFVNEHFTRRIVELSATESDLLLGYLKQWVSSPRFHVRYRWSQGAVAIWDNRCTQHMVLSDFDQERVIQRVTVMGDTPQGAKPRWPSFVRPGVRSDTSRHDAMLRKYLRSRSEESVKD